MIQDFILISTSIAGIAVLWRNFLEDHPKVKTRVRQRLGNFSKILLCGSCFTYWLTLILILTFVDLDLLFSKYKIINIFLTWMSLSYAGVFLRFSYVLIQEKVSRLVHSKHNH